MWPIFFHIHNHEIGTFGVIVAAGTLLCLLIARSLGKRDDLNPTRVNDIALAVLFFGFLGSKLLGVLVAWVGGMPLSWAELRNAGAVHGGLFAGAVSCYLLARHYRLPLPALFDAYAPAVALGQAIGRLGCFAAGCCFGSSCDLPWAVQFTDPRAAELGGVPLNVPVHPVQLYDTAAHLALFAVLYFMHRHKHLHGRLFGAWCIFEGTVRFSIESFRGDLGRGVWLGLDWLSTGRVTALAFIALGAVVLVWQRSSAAKTVRSAQSDTPAI